MVVSFKIIFYTVHTLFRGLFVFFFFVFPRFYNTFWKLVLIIYWSDSIFSSLVENQWPFTVDFSFGDEKKLKRPNLVSRQVWGPELSHDLSTFFNRIIVHWCVTLSRLGSFLVDVFHFEMLGLLVILCATHPHSACCNIRKLSVIGFFFFFFKFETEFYTRFFIVSKNKLAHYIYIYTSMCTSNTNQV